MRLSKADKLAAAGAVAPVIRQRAGVGGRRVILTDAAGRPVRESTDVDVAKSLLARADIEFSVVPGKRPEWVRCKLCGEPVRQPNRGKVRTVCARKASTCVGCGKRLTPRSGDCRSGDRCAACIVAQAKCNNRRPRRRSPVAHVTLNCGRCGAPITRRSRTGRCATCARRDVISSVRGNISAEKRSEAARRANATRRASNAPDAERIRAAIEAHGGNVSAAAAALGVPRTTLKRHAAALTIPRNRKPGPARKSGIV